MTAIRGDAVQNGDDETEKAKAVKKLALRESKLVQHPYSVKNY